MFAPDPVSLFGEVDVVFEEAGFEGFVGIEEVFVVADDVRVRQFEFAYFGIDFFSEDAEVVFGVRAIRRCFEDDDVCVREFVQEGCDDFFDAFDCFLGRLFSFPHADVVGSDHQDAYFRGRGCGEFGVFHAPEDVFGAVSADSKVDGFERHEFFIPYFFAYYFPLFGDGVADEEDVAGQVGHTLFYLGIAGWHPVSVVVHRDDGGCRRIVVGWSRSQERGNSCKEAGGGNECGSVHDGVWSRLWNYTGLLTFAAIL